MTMIDFVWLGFEVVKHVNRVTIDAFMNSVR